MDVLHLSGSVALCCFYSPHPPSSAFVDLYLLSVVLIVAPAFRDV